MANGFYYNGAVSTIETTGSLNVQTFGVTGSLLGTSSYANRADTASFVTLAQTASYVVTAQTASYVNITGSGIFVNYNGSQIQLTSSAEAQTLQAVTSLGNTTSASINIFDGVSINTTGSYTFTHGETVSATGDYAHAQGVSTLAAGKYAHVEGQGTLAIGDSSHTEGQGTTSVGNWSHAEGINNVAIGDGSHAEGYVNTSIGVYSHAEGSSTTAKGDKSHAEGIGTITSGEGQHVEGRWNLEDTTAYWIVGDGINNTTRSNLVVAYQNKVTITGSLEVQGAITGSLSGSIHGNLIGSVTGSVSGSLRGTVTGSMSGSLVGSASGSFTGSFSGSLVGSVSGSFTGSMSGSLTGSVFGTASWANTAVKTTVLGVTDTSSYNAVLYNPNTGYLLYQVLPQFTVQGTGYNNSIDAIAFLPTGQLTVAGRFTNYNSTASGYFNVLNNAGLQVTTPFAYTNGFNAIFVSQVIFIDSGNKVILASRDATTYNGSAYTKYSRYMPDGTLDTTFANGTGWGPSGAPITSITETTDKGYINCTVSVGTWNGVSTTNRLFRVGASGSLNTAFSTNVATSLAAFPGTNQEHCKLPDGKICVWVTHPSTFSSGGTMRILNEDGTNYATFTTNAPVQTNANISQVIVEPGSSGLSTDYKLLVCGHAAVTSWNGTATGGNWFRISKDGVLDNTFTAVIAAGVAVVQTAQDGFYDTVEGVYFLGGNFTTINGSSSEYISSITNTGAVNTSFVRPAGGFFNNTVSQLKKYPNQQYLMVAGTFTTYGGASAPALARLNYNGKQS